MDYNDKNDYVPINVMRKTVITLESHYENSINIMLTTTVMLNVLAVTNVLKHRLQSSTMLIVMENSHLCATCAKKDLPSTVN